MLDVGFFKVLQVNSIRYINVLWKMTLKIVGLVLSKQRNEKFLKINNRWRRAVLKQMKKSRQCQYRKITISKETEGKADKE